MQRQRFAHVLIGSLGLAAFLLTGQYMHHYLDHLRGMPDGPRLLYRSSHIYLLWSSLLNLVLGCYVECSAIRAVRRAQSLASLALAAGPALLVASFFAESDAGTLQRPLARIAIYLALGGALAHALCRYLPGTRCRPPAGGG